MPVFDPDPGHLREAVASVLDQTLTDVELLCHRVAIIVEGRIRYAGSVDEFLDAGDRESDVVLAGFPAELAEELEEGFDATLRQIGDRTTSAAFFKRVK